MYVQTREELERKCSVLSAELRIISEANRTENLAKEEAESAVETRNAGMVVRDGCKGRER